MFHSVTCHLLLSGAESAPVFAFWVIFCRFGFSSLKEEEKKTLKSIIFLLLDAPVLYLFVAARLVLRLGRIRSAAIFVQISPDVRPPLLAEGPDVLLHAHLQQVGQ